MKIVQFIPYLDRGNGGPPEVVRQFARGFATRGHEAHVCFFDSAPWPEDRVPGVIYHDLSGVSMRGVLLSVTSRQRIENVIYGADSVLLHTAWQPLHLFVRRACMRLEVPFAYMPHGMLDAYCMRQKLIRKRLYLELAEGRLLRDASRILMTTHAERERSAQALGSNHAPVAIVPLGVEADGDMVPVSMARDVVFLGRLHPKKGLERLLVAWHAWRDRPQDVSLRIAGRGDPAYERNLHRLVHELGIGASVTFEGERYGHAKWALLSQARVFVLPSYQENFGLAVAEALCSGVRAVVAEGVNISSDVRALGGAVVPEGADFERRFALAMSECWNLGDERRCERASNAKIRFDWRLSVSALLRAIEVEAANRVERPG